MISFKKKLHSTLNFSECPFSEADQPNSHSFSICMSHAQPSHKHNNPEKKATQVNRRSACTTMEVDVRELHTGTRVQRASDPFQRQKMMIEEEEAEEEEHSRCIDFTRGEPTHEISQGKKERGVQIW